MQSGASRNRAGLLGTSAPALAGIRRQKAVAALCENRHNSFEKSISSVFFPQFLKKRETRVTELANLAR